MSLLKKKAKSSAAFALAFVLTFPLESEINPIRRIAGTIRKAFHFVKGPAYDGEAFKRILEKQFGETKLDETLTKLVIPTFDIKKLHPTIFSSFESKNFPPLNAKLSDICIGTCSTPTYLPPHQFTDPDSGEQFHLIDGGVAANNPTIVAINQVIKEDYREKSSVDLKKYDGRFLVISIGSGSASAREEKKHNAERAKKWGSIDWVRQGVFSPIADAFFQASSALVDFRTSVLFQALNCEHYLRIQENSLEGDNASVDITTQTNLDELEQIGKRLLGKDVSRVNMKTRLYEPLPHLGINGVDCRTNEDALRSFAKLLINEKKRPDAKKAADEEPADSFMWPPPYSL